MTKKRKMSPLAEHIYRICVMSAIAAVAGLIFGATGAKVALIIFAVILGIVAFFEMRDKPSLDSFGYIILALLCGGGALVVNVTDKAKCEYEAIIESPSADKCRYYLMNHTHLYVEKVMDIYLDCAIVDGIFELDKLATSYPETEQGKDAIERINFIVEERYKQAEKENSSKAWESFCYSMPKKYRRDAKERIEEAKYREWGTDENAWNTAKSEDRIAMYEKYINDYPNGRYVRLAKKRIRDMRLREELKDVPQDLPEMIQISSNNSNIANLKVTNDTKYTLTVVYYGDYRNYELKIDAGQTGAIDIRIGKYTVIASVTDPNVRSHYNVQTFTGGEYYAAYHITTIFQKYAYELINNLPKPPVFLRK